MTGWSTPARSSACRAREGGDTGIDEDFAARGMAGIGAWILGRNMFGPIRGPWPDESWRGWWGKNPPYHTPVFVLTHHARPPLEMEGGTVFHFVTEGIHAALERARAAAGRQDIRLLGGVATIRQYLQARLVDEMHLAVSPILLGSGEHLLAGLDLPALGYRMHGVRPQCEGGALRHRANLSPRNRLTQRSAHRSSFTTPCDNANAPGFPMNRWSEGPTAKRRCGSNSSSKSDRPDTILSAM